MKTIPSENSVNKAEKRIRSRADLSRELEESGVNIRDIAHLIAKAKYYDEPRWQKVNRKKLKAQDAHKHKKIYWNAKTGEESDRSKHLRAMTTSMTRIRLVSRHAEKIGISLTKRRPYLHELLINLDYLLSDKTEIRFKYIAGLFNLFNLHVENFCEGCKFLARGNQMCRKRNIFQCPNHGKARKKLWYMTREAKKALPPPKYPR